MTDGDKRVRFAQFEADFRSGEVFRNGVKIPLQEKPFQVLRLLLHAQGGVVTREQIYAEVWPDTHVAEAASLNTAIRKLRAALGDDARDSRLIQTVETGYRLLVEPRFPTSASLRDRNGRTRLALAPFENLGSEDQDYFADGITEELIAQLGRTHREISIIAPFSTMRYKGSAMQIVNIARDLRADYVLAGSVLVSGGSVQVTARLIRSEGQVCIWSDSYARDEGDIFSIEDEITQRIAGAILTVLTGSGTRARHLTTDSWTYEKFLKGCFFANKWSEAGFRKAIELLQKTIEEDPEFAPAHAALAKLYMGMSAQGILPPSVINERTRAAASRALHLCPDLADAVTALGSSQLFYDGDWRAAEQSFLRSIEINPSATHAYERYSHLLTAVRRHDEALELALRACELDPLSPFAANMLGCTYYFAGQYEEARACLQDCIDTHPAFPIAHACLSWVYGALGEMEKAVASQRLAVEQNQGSPAMLANLAHTLGVAGYRDEALQVLTRVLEARQSIWVPPYWIALAYLAIGDHDAVFDWLARGIEERCGWRIYYGVDPKLEALAADDRFRTILNRVGFPQSDAGIGTAIKR
ncbi:MAG TPA: tetratricopeptide repeat protein [Terriglobales bacterium]|nr:tetratricopeptide repeat protein [Terriglobales bacterium]